MQNAGGMRKCSHVARRLLRTVGGLSIACLTACGILQAFAADQPHHLELGFRLMYELKFAEARRAILAYQREQPRDPMGEAAEAASYLFDEFNRQGVLTSAFFLNDDRLLGGVAGSPDPQNSAAFVEAVRRTRSMAQLRLKTDAENPDALLALTLSDGMESDFEALIEKHQIESLSLMRRAQHEAAALLQVAPDSYDAFFAIGAADYIIGCLPAYKRVVLWFGGFRGNRQRGMATLEKTATNGHYLKPLAKVFLALAAEREHEFDRARELLADLHRQFPDNPVFAHELELAAQRTSTTGDQSPRSGTR